MSGWFLHAIPTIKGNAMEILFMLFTTQSTARHSTCIAVNRCTRFIGTFLT